MNALYGAHLYKATFSGQLWEMMDGMLSDTRGWGSFSLHALWPVAFLSVRLLVESSKLHAPEERGRYGRPTCSRMSLILFARRSQPAVHDRVRGKRKVPESLLGTI
jgi:hypothetical protein